MSKTRWEVNIVTSEEIIQHIQQHHIVPWNDRKALTYIEFIDEHFNDEKGLVRYGLRDKKRSECKRKIRLAIKICEKEGIPFTQVWDFNEVDYAELRLCQPNQEQVDYAKSDRYERIVFGLLFKIENILQMVDDKLSMTEVVKVYNEWKKDKK